MKEEREEEEKESKESNLDTSQLNCQELIKKRTFLKAFRGRKKACQDEKEDNHSRLHTKDYASQKTIE